MPVTTSMPREKRDRRLGDRLTVTTSLRFEEAFEAIRRVCERESERRDTRYHVVTHRNHILVGYRAGPRAAARLTASRTRLHAGHWLLAVRFPCDDHLTVTTPRRQTVEIRLTNWVVDSDGRRECSDKYRELADSICEAVGGRFIRWRRTSP